MTEVAQARPQIVYAFPGQGSQTYHMGQVLYQRQPVFREWMHALDERVRDRIGRSVLEELYSQSRRRSDAFDDIRLTHPAIFMVEYAMTQVLRAAGIEPDIVLGASLGEYCAAVLARLISLDSALDSVVRQAEIFHRLCSTGGMLAILAPQSLYERVAVLRERTEIASFNFGCNFVVAGPVDALEEAQRQLTQDDVVSQRLPVRQAFHSALMDPARAEVLQLMRAATSSAAALPCISCTTAAALQAVEPQYFWDVVRKPIQIARAIAHLEAEAPHLYLDLGPGGTFANFVKYNTATRQGSRAFALLTPFGRDMDALDATLAALSATHARRVAP